MSLISKKKKKKTESKLPQIMLNLLTVCVQVPAHLDALLAQEVSGGVQHVCGVCGVVVGVTGVIVGLDDLQP